MIIHVLECSPNASDATSYYRSRGPLAALERAYPDQIKVSYMGNFHEATWADILPFDVIFVQRPSNQRELEFISLCGTAHKKIWVDYDDLLTDIPQSNPVHGGAKDNTWIIPSILNASDLVTVSTNTLRSKFIKYNPNTHVVKNAHDDFLFHVEHKELPNLEAENQKIAWRGSPTHDADLFFWSKTLKQVSENYPMYTFGRFSEFMRMFYNVQRENMFHSMSVLDFMHEFYRFNAPITVFPLEDNLFNQAKSNICALETLYAGGICFVPEGFAEFTGTALTFNENNLLELIDSVLSDKEKFIKLHNALWENVCKSQLLSITNKKRLELILSL